MSCGASIVAQETTACVVEVIHPGPQGPPGPAGPAGTSGSYVHVQSVAATTWTINHNLGYRPSVELLDSGSQEIDADVSHPTVNQTVVSLTPASAGLARLL